jgi:hypothetical protein
MLKTGILNPAINSLLSRVRHTSAPCACFSTA